MRMVFRLKRMAVVFMLSALAVVFVAPPPADAGLEKKIEMFYYFQYWAQFRSIGSGPDNDRPTKDFFFRRNRLGFYGDVNDTMGFYAQTQMREADRRITLNNVRPGNTTANATVDLIDAYMTLYWTDAFQMIGGRFKNAFSRSNLEGCAQPITLDRSFYVYEPYRISRDTGWAAWGNLGDKVGYKLAVFEGRDGDNDFGSGLEPSSNLKYVAHLQYSFLEPEFSYSYAGTNMGFRRILTVGAAYSTEADVVYSKHSGGDSSSADTTPGGAKDYKAMTADLFFEYPFSFATITFATAYFDFSWDGAAYSGVHPDSSSYGYFGERRGFYVKGAYLPSWRLGPGKIQFAGRIDSWRFAKIGDTFDQALTYTEATLNYYMLNNVVKLTLAYGWTVFDKLDLSAPEFQDFETATFQVQMVY